MAVVDLALQRLDRLEKGQRELKAQVEESMGRVVDVLEAHSRHFERMEDALIGIAERVDGLGARMDRLATAIARGRTQDLARFENHERRLRTLERRNGGRRKRT
jgi:predicted  nucleic acid-binding Zn-ribbon protein